VVLLHIVQAGALAHSYTRITEVVIGDYLTRGQILLVVLVNVKDGLPVFRLLDAPPVTVIDIYGFALPIRIGIGVVISRPAAV